MNGRKIRGESRRRARRLFMTQTVAPDLYVKSFHVPIARDRDVTDAISCWCGDGVHRRPRWRKCHQDLVAAERESAAELVEGDATPIGLVVGVLRRHAEGGDVLHRHEAAGTALRRAVSCGGCRFEDRRCYRPSWPIPAEGGTSNALYFTHPSRSREPNSRIRRSVRGGAPNGQERRAAARMRVSAAATGPTPLRLTPRAAFDTLLLFPIILAFRLVMPRHLLRFSWPVAPIATSAIPSTCSCSSSSGPLLACRPIGSSSTCSGPHGSS